MNINVGIAGLGRLGSVHARNICNKIQGATLTAACSLEERELAFASKELGVNNVYKDYNKMLENANIDAVVIVTSSGEHCWQIEAALNAGKHVFCDKPLGVNVDECKKVEKTVEKYPKQVFFLGFMRRFDPSYAYAKQKIDAGLIGTPYLIKATGIDPEALVEGTIKFSETSGGIFIDAASHDIDLMRWFLNAEPVEVYAAGCSFKHPEFIKYNDCETGCALLKFDNGSMGQMHVGRTAAHGYHIETEIIGTEGSIRIGSVPEKNQATLYNRSGVVKECVESFPERFAEAYILEMQEFIDCISEGRKPSVSAHDGTRTTQATFAASQSFKQQCVIAIDN